jgi:hypothetical protein
LSLGNLLVRDESLYVVDFAYSGPSYYELDPVILRTSLLTSLGHWPLSGAARAALWSAFNDGYGQRACSEVDQAAADLLQLHALLFNVAKLSSPGSGSAWATVRRSYKLRLAVGYMTRWLGERGRAYGI